jgi:phage terminase large subunit-like protein
VVPRLNPDNYSELVYPQDSKVVRALAWSPAQRAGNVYLPEGADWLEEYIAEHERFPKGTHDDDVDASSLAMNALRTADLDASAALCELPSRVIGGGWR